MLQKNAKQNFLMPFSVSFWNNVLVNYARNRTSWRDFIFGCSYYSANGFLFCENTDRQPCASVWAESIKALQLNALSYWTPWYSLYAQLEIKTVVKNLCFISSKRGQNTNATDSKYERLALQSRWCTGTSFCFKYQIPAVRKPLDITHFSPQWNHHCINLGWTVEFKLFSFTIIRQKCLNPG